MMLLKSLTISQKVNKTFSGARLIACASFLHNEKNKRWCRLQPPSLCCAMPQIEWLTIYKAWAHSNNKKIRFHRRCHLIFVSRIANAAVTKNQRSTRFCLFNVLAKEELRRLNVLWVLKIAEQRQLMESCCLNFIYLSNRCSHQWWIVDDDIHLTMERSASSNSWMSQLGADTGV